MANLVSSGVPLSFEQFCTLAELEPNEVSTLKAVAGSGERPLRTWVQLMADNLGLRTPRQPLTVVVNSNAPAPTQPTTSTPQDIYFTNSQLLTLSEVGNNEYHGFGGVVTAQDATGSIIPNGVVRLGYISTPGELLPS